MGLYQFQASLVWQFSMNGLPIPAIACPIITQQKPTFTNKRSPVPNRHRSDPTIMPILEPQVSRTYTAGMVQKGSMRVNIKVPKLTTSAFQLQIMVRQVAIGVMVLNKMAVIICMSAKSATIAILAGQSLNYLLTYFALYILILYLRFKKNLIYRLTYSFLNLRVMKTNPVYAKNQKMSPPTRFMPKQKKFSIHFNRIKFLKSLRDKFETLPVQKDFKIANETEYLRIITSILQDISRIRIQEIQYIVSEKSLAKLLTQLNNLTFHKEVVLSLLKQLFKGCSAFIPQIQGDLYQILAFMIQIDGLSANQACNTDKQTDLSLLSKAILGSSVLSLIQSIQRWYFMGSDLQGLRNKYRKLKETLKNNNYSS